MRSVVTDIPICIESPEQDDEEVLENFVLAGLFDCICTLLLVM